MTLNEMIYLLNEDLSREYFHWHFYTQAAGMVNGLHRAEYAELFAEHAAGEAKHIGEFQKLILGLGGTPTMETAKIPQYNLPTNWLPVETIRYAVSMEQDVVNNYVKRLEQAEELQKVDKVNGKYIELFLEDQILDSRGDVDEFNLILKNAHESYAS